MTPAKASPPHGFQRQGPVLRLDERLLAGTEAAGWRLPVVVRPANEEAPVPEAAHRRDAFVIAVAVVLFSSSLFLIVS